MPVTFTTIPAGNKFIRVNWGGELGEQWDCIRLPEPLLKKMGLQPGTTVVFRVGSLRRSVTVEKVHCSSELCEPLFFVSPDLACACQIPAGTAVTLKYSPYCGTLAAGPLIGLFTVRNVLPESEYGTQESTLAALTESSLNLFGFVFVFCPEDIDWAAPAVTGYFPVPDPETGSPSWAPLRLPLPDVVYDRLPSRTIEARPEVIETKSRLMTDAGLSYFNPRFLNKWETYLALQDIPEVKGYLPPTGLVESPDDISEYLNLYGSVFLKPSSGSLGRKIIKVELNEEGHYRFMYRSREKQTVEGIAADFTSLAGMLRRIMGRRTYVVQKDLHLARFGQCPFDIRVLAQKDRWGNWRRTKTYVRVAAPDNFLSNLSDGAKPKGISTVLKEVFNCDFLARDGLGEEIRNAVKTIPPALEKGTATIWGELGLDLGLDETGRVWLIEINSKPFRGLVSNGYSVKVIERSLMRPLEYAKFLAGFYRHSPPPSPPQAACSAPEQAVPEDETALANATPLQET